MKRNLSTTMLTLFLAGGCLGVLNSCKDYDDDLRSELLASDANLNDLVTDQANRLDERVDSLKGWVNTIKSCECNLDEKLQDYVSKDEFSSMFADEMSNYQVGEKTITEVITYLNTEVSKAKVDIERVEKDLKSNQDDLKAYKDSLLAINNRLNMVSADAASNLEAITKLSEDFKDLDKSVTDLNNTIIGWGDSLRIAYQTAAEASALANTNKEKLEAYNKVFSYKTDSLSTITANLQDSIDKVVALTNENLTLAKDYTDQALTIAKNELLDSINFKVDNIKNTYDLKLTDLEDAYKKADKELQEQLDTLKERMQAVEERSLANSNAIGGIIGVLNNLVTGIIVQATENPVFGSISTPLDVRSNVLMAYYGTSKVADREFPTSMTSFDVNKENCFTLADINILKECGLEPEKIYNGATLFDEKEGNAGTIYLTVNPANTNFENLNVSLVNSQDKNSGMILGGLEKTDKTLAFGYTRAANNGFYAAKAYLPKDKISDVKIEIEPGLMSDMKEVIENKGKNIDFTSLISKVYSQFNGKLDANGVKCGWTDSLGDHAVYSQYNVAATAFKPLSFKFLEGQSISLPTINPLNDLSNFDVKNYFDTSVLNFNFQYDDHFNVELGEQSFNVKLDSINFTFEFDDLDFSTVNSLVHIKDTITIEIPNADNAYVNTTTNQVEGITTQIDTIYVDCTVTLNDFVTSLSSVISEQIATQMSAQINNKLNGQINQWNESLNTQLKNQMNDMMASISEQMEEQVNDMLDSLLATINTDLNDKVDDILDQINEAVRNSAGGYVGKLNNYITKVNSYVNRINSILGNANSYLQVTMLYAANDGSYHQLSNTKAIPTVFKIGSGNSTMLLPTTYTAEIIVPTYKKFVAVTNVYKDGKSAQAGDNTCKELLKKANNLKYVNEVIDGKSIAVPFEIDPSKSGYTYEITYSAIDYSGYSSTRKFYVKVVE